MMSADTGIAHSDPSDEELADALRLAIGRLARKLRQQSLGDMTPSQRSVLASLDRHGPMRLGELARVENISAPSLSGIVGRLEARGLVSRDDDPDDARSVIVAATPEAISELALARRERTALLMRAVASLTPDERMALAAVLPILDRMVGGE
jgi:DNA-binding MarR family transcriptional regulator